MHSIGDEYIHPACIVFTFVTVDARRQARAV